MSRPASQRHSDPCSPRRPESGRILWRTLKLLRRMFGVFHLHDEASIDSLNLNLGETIFSAYLTQTRVHWSPPVTTPSATPNSLLIPKERAAAAERYSSLSRHICHVFVQRNQHCLLVESPRALLVVFFLLRQIGSPACLALLWFDPGDLGSIWIVEQMTAASS